MIDVYFEEFKENSDSIKKKFFAPDSDAKFKEIANLLKENQNVVKFWCSYGLDRNGANRDVGDEHSSIGGA